MITILPLALMLAAVLLMVSLQLCFPLVPLAILLTWIWVRGL